MRPTMRFVKMKTEDQCDLQALHRIRDRMVANRTQLICQMRAFCLEYGIAMRQGAGAFKVDIARIIADEHNGLSATMRAILKELWNEFALADTRLAVITRKLEALAGGLEAARRLMTIPGIGPLSATALVAAVGDGRQFRKARRSRGVAWSCAPPELHSVARRRCSASASVVALICVGSSSTAHDLASRT